MLKLCKRLVSTVIVLLIVVSSVIFVNANGIYTDVPDDAWYKEAAEYCYNKGLIVGVGSHVFGGDIPVNREMFATIVYRIEGSPEPNITLSQTKLLDVSDNYAKVPILWAYESEITAGTSKTTFSGKSSITREQLVTMLHRYASIKGLRYSDTGRTLSYYSDTSDISSWALSSVQWAVKYGIIEEKVCRGTNLLKPKSNCTRAEAASMVYNFLSKASNTEYHYYKRLILEDKYKRKHFKGDPALTYWLACKTCDGRSTRDYLDVSIDGVKYIALACKQFNYQKALVCVKECEGKGNPIEYAVNQSWFTLGLTRYTPTVLDTHRDDIKIFNDMYSVHTGSPKSCAVSQSSVQSEIGSRPKMYGRLVIPRVNINVGLFQCDISESSLSQQYVDAQDSAAYILHYGSNSVIGDHVTQAFSTMSNVKYGDIAYIVTGSETQRFMCVGVGTGRNRSNDLVDSDGTSLRQRSKDGIVMYTCKDVFGGIYYSLWQYID